MRVGLIARCDNTGLAIQSKEFFDHIPNCKALVIDSSELMKGEGVLHPHYDRFPGQTVFRLQPGFRMTGVFPEKMIREFIKDIDILFAMETPYDYDIFRICREAGVKTVLQINYEFLDYPSSRLPVPDLLAAPSMWNYGNIPGNKAYLPVPVNTTHFRPEKKERVFVHNGGRPAVHDRNGTRTFMNSLQFVKSDITVIVRSQKPIPLPVIKAPNINLITDFSNKYHYHENYTGGVLVLPRKYGGLCLPINEALAAEMPVITNDISPNNTWLPQEWLVKANVEGVLRCKKNVEYFDADVISLAAKIDDFCDSNFYNTAVEKAKQIKSTISWDALLPLYTDTFRKLMQ